MDEKAMRALTERLRERFGPTSDASVSVFSGSRDTYCSVAVWTNGLLRSESICGHGPTMADALKNFENKVLEAAR